MRQLVVLGCVSALLSVWLPACNDATQAPRAAFYYWQTRFSLDRAQAQALDSLGCRELWVKYLDIGPQPDQGGVAPLSRLEVADTAGLQGRQVHPCVFIVNQVFMTHQSPEKVRWLAEKTCAALQQTDAQWRRPALAQPGTVLQIDCDWTPGTRAAYFLFLNEIKKLLAPGVLLSATIRLHQFKFPEKTGVPPADRGTLMLYNSGDIDDPDAGNSILDAAETRKYLQHAPEKYLLPLDLALPLFDWALVFRQSELWKIIPAPAAADLADTARFTLTQRDTLNGLERYAVKKGTFMGGHYLRPEDQLRREYIAPGQLRALAQASAPIRLASEPRIAFYQLDSLTLQRYSPRFLKTIWQVYEKK
jgi:hypothetical protein